MTATTEPLAPDTPDWDAVRDETVALLQRLLRIDTTNPPGNEVRLARELEATLAAAGIETHLFEPSPGRATLVARLRGTGARAPVALYAHMDVVGVEYEKWSTDPFGGELRDGYVYGRGAIDDKGMLAANVMTLLLLKRHVLDRGGALSRDVVLVATSDEETGGEWGIEWVLAHHPELARAEFALNEGGRVRVVDGRPLYVAVQTAEKVPHVVRVRAEGPGGHAAVPLAGNAIVRLGRALSAIGAHREPLTLTATTRGFFAALSVVWPEPAVRRAMRDLVSREPRCVARGASALARVPVLDAVLRNGISPTLVEGGVRTNVIPTEATARLNVRTLPGASIDDVVARLRQVVADPLVQIEVESRGEDAPPSDVDSPLFVALAESARALLPSLSVVPYLSTGATDSAHLRRAGVQCLGVLPFPLSQDDEERMHGHDERVPVDALLFGVRLVHGAVLRVAG